MQNWIIYRLLPTTLEKIQENSRSCLPHKIEQYSRPLLPVQTIWKKNSETPGPVPPRNLTEDLRIRRLYKNCLKLKFSNQLTWVEILWPTYRIPQKTVYNSVFMAWFSPSGDIWHKWILGCRKSVEKPTLKHVW